MFNSKGEELFRTWLLNQRSSVRNVAEELKKKGKFPFSTLQSFYNFVDKEFDKHREIEIAAAIEDLTDGSVPIKTWVEKANEDTKENKMTCGSE